MLADPWQGLQLMQRLRARGVHATEYAFSQASKQRLAQTLLHSLNAGNLRLYEAEGLRDELLALRLRQSASGAWSFDHARGGHDDRAVALALMLVGALESGSHQTPVFVEAGSLATDLDRALDGVGILRHETLKAGELQGNTARLAHQHVPAVGLALWCRIT